MPPPLPAPQSLLPPPAPLVPFPQRLAALAHNVILSRRPTFAFPPLPRSPSPLHLQVEPHWTPSEKKDLAEQAESGIRLPTIDGKTSEAVRRQMQRLQLTEPPQVPFPTAVEDHDDEHPPFLHLNYDSWTLFDSDKAIPPEAELDFENGCARIPENWPLELANVDAEPASDSDAGPGADADAGPGRAHQLGNKQVFRAASRRTLAPCPPPRLGTRRARVRTRRYLWTVQAPRPARTVAVLNHLRADASY